MRGEGREGEGIVMVIVVLVRECLNKIQIPTLAVCRESEGPTIPHVMYITCNLK